MSYEKPSGPHHQGTGQFPITQTELDKIEAEKKAKKKPFKWVFNDQAQ